jgi:flagellar hook assembly protein FlgD
MGRIEYQQIALCAYSSGIREAFWNGRNLQNQKVASGMYIIKMTAFDENSLVMGSFKREIVYLP